MSFFVYKIQFELSCRNRAEKLRGSQETHSCCNLTKVSSLQQSVHTLSEIGRLKSG